MILLMCFLINTCPCIIQYHYNKDEMYTIKSIIDTKVNACNTVYTISVADVSNAVTHLKTGKSDGSKGLKSDHFINGTNKLYVILSLYVLMLDASKAFDRVNYCKLFSELLRRDASPLILRLLLHMYTTQTLRVRIIQCLMCLVCQTV